MKKLSLKEQCSRIQEIMKNEHMTTCKDCKKTYLALTYESECVCVYCGCELLELDVDLYDYEDDYEMEIY